MAYALKLASGEAKSIGAIPGRSNEPGGECLNADALRGKTASETEA
jgi:hypothetical protein